MLQFEAEYFGGNFNLKIDGGLRKTNVLLQVEESRLTVFLAVAPLARRYLPQPSWTVQYSDITRIECLPSERVGALRMLVLPAPAAVALRKREFYLNITYRDAIGMEQNIAFKVKNAEACYQAVYEKIAECRRRQ